MSKSVMIIDTPRDCCECPFGTMAFGKSICLLDEGNGIDCPLKPYKDFILIEWIKNYAKRKASKGFTEIDCYWQYWEEDVLKMVADWEKENDKGSE